MKFIGALHWPASRMSVLLISGILWGQPSLGSAQTVTSTTAVKSATPVAVVAPVPVTSTTAVSSAPPIAVVAPVPSAGAPHWGQMPGPYAAKMKQVAVGSATSIWGLDNTGTLWKWSGVAWDKKGCCVTGNLSATADGALWATHPPNNNRVLRWNGDKWDENFPTGMTQVAAVNGKNVWGLDSTGSHYLYSGTTWDKKGCCVTQISVANDGSLWATHPPNNNRVLRWNTNRWDENYPTGMVYIAAGSATNVWGLNGADQVFRLTGATWQAMPGTLHSISASADGNVWGVNAKGDIFKWFPK